MEELAEKHVAIALLDDKVAVLDLDSNLQSAEVVFAILNAARWHEELAGVQSVAHQNINLIVHDGLVLDTLRLDFSVQVPFVLLFLEKFLTLGLLDLVFQLVYLSFSLLNDLVELVGMVDQRLHLGVISAELLLVDTDFFIKLVVFKLNLLDLPLDFLAHLFLLQDVAFGKIDRNLDSLDVFAYSGHVSVGNSRLFEFFDQLLDARNPACDDLFKLADHLFQLDLRLLDVLLISLHTLVA